MIKYSYAEKIVDQELKSSKTLRNSGIYAALKQIAFLMRIMWNRSRPE